MTIDLLEKNYTKTKSTSCTIKQHAKKIIESLLFSSSDPLSLSKITKILSTEFSCSKKEVQHFIEELNKDYLKEKRAFEILKAKNEYTLKTKEQYYPYVSQLTKEKTTSLSKACKEVVAILAFKGPLCRNDIEAIRQKDSSNTIKSLIEKGFLDQKKGEGRAKILHLSKKFYQHFGIEDHKSLSKLKL